jgi:hypothetical protein
MGKMRDLTGTKFNKLTVIEFSHKKLGVYYWKCLCDCGNPEYVIVAYNSIINASTKSCGCTHGHGFDDLTGLKFNRLTVRSLAYMKKGASYWNCQCDCGKDTVVRHNSLVGGVTKSCGCYKNELNRMKRKENRYEFVDDYVIGHSEDGKVFCFDKKDLDLVKDYYWNTYGRYVTAHRDNKSILMHRLIMNAPPDKVVDHIDHNETNNRRYNLRICTDHENVINKRLSKINKTGKTGVFMENGKYRAVIYFNGKNIHLGTHTTFEEAVRSRIEAEKIYFGEFADSSQQEDLPLAA